MFGLSFGGSKSKSKTNPWAPQGRQLEYAFDEARNIYENQGPYTGDYASQMGNVESGYISGVQNYLGGAGANAVDQQMMYGLQGMSSLPQAQQMYQNLPTQQITSEQIANNMNMDLVNKQVSGASSAISDMLAGAQNANDVNAASSGNLGSSMQARVQAEASQNAANQMANTYNNIFNQQYQNTQSLMQQQQQMQQNSMLNAASGLTNIANMGAQANQTANAMQMNNFGLQQQAAGLERAQADRNIDNQLGQHYAANDWLDRFMGTIGGQSWGGETSGKNKSFGFSLQGGK